MNIPLLTVAIAACVVACALADTNPVVLPTVGALRPVLKGDALATQARITTTAAEEIALTERRGVIREEELENEVGGSGLRYSFVIGALGRDYEVGVDARTGQVLENSAASSVLD